MRVLYYWSTVINNIFALLAMMMGVDTQKATVDENIHTHKSKKHFPFMVVVVTDTAHCCLRKKEDAHTTHLTRLQTHTHTHTRGDDR